MSTDMKEGLVTLGIVLFVWLLGFGAGLRIGIEVEKSKIEQPFLCEEALFQRTLSFKLEDWEIRARKKLGNQWLCYEVGETIIKSGGGLGGPRIRVVFIKKEEQREEKK